MSTTCRVCGKDVPFLRCDDCYERYREDIRTGHIPPRFLAEGVDFEFDDWVHIKVTEKRCANLGMPLDEARREVDFACSERIAYHTTMALSQSPAARAKKAADERIKKYSTY